jgi:hypothetical protein
VPITLVPGARMDDRLPRVDWVDGDFMRGSSEAE